MSIGENCLRTNCPESPVFGNFACCSDSSSSEIGQVTPNRHQKYPLRDKLEVLHCYMRTRPSSFLSRFNRHGYFVELLPVSAGRKGEAKNLIDWGPVQGDMPLLARRKYQTSQRLCG